MPHLAVVTSYGDVYDISLFESVSPSKSHLMKLSRCFKYHVYSDPKGILYFFDGEFNKPVVQFHPQINDLGHQKIPMKGTIDKFVWSHFMQSIPIGKYFWIFERSEREPFYPHDLRYSRKILKTLQILKI